MIGINLNFIFGCDLGQVSPQEVCYTLNASHRKHLLRRCVRRNLPTQPGDGRPPEEHAGATFSHSVQTVSSRQRGLRYEDFDET